jgi:hypothetical protein
MKLQKGGYRTGFEYVVPEFRYLYALFTLRYSANVISLKIYILNTFQNLCIKRYFHRPQIYCNCLFIC